VLSVEGCSLFPTNEQRGSGRQAMLVRVWRAEGSSRPAASFVNLQIPLAAGISTKRAG